MKLPWLFPIIIKMIGDVGSLSHTLEPRCMAYVEDILKSVQ